MRAVQSPVIPAVAELIRAHPGTIPLGQGVVYYGPPPEAIDEAAACLADPENHKYKAVDGIPRLRESIAAKLAAENGIRTDEAPRGRVVVTAGANMAFMNAVLAVADPGDEVILPRPYYFNHDMAVVTAGCRPVFADTGDGYQLRPEAIAGRITPRTRAVVTVSPNNPTGAVYPRAALRAVNELCARHGIYHISDEVYEYFTYGEPPGGAGHFSPGSLPGASAHTISLYSLSKAYGFAGWRIGYMVVPDHLYDAVLKIQDTILICPPVASQFAAAGALAAGRAYCEGQMREIRRARQVVLSELGRLGGLCTVPPADGAVYCFVRVHTAMPAMALVERLVREYGVATIPGDTFGMPADPSGCHLRLGYGALREATAAEGIGRFVKGVRAIVKT